MVFTQLLAFPWLLSLSCAFVQSPVKGPLKGFNYNPEDDAEKLFPLVQDDLPKIGAPGFGSARLYTALDPTADKPTPHPAFKAAGDSNTSVLIGLAVSLGDDSFQDELTALTAVLKDKDNTYGNLVSKNLIVGISVGNEDLYRQYIQGTDLAKKQGSGSKPPVLMKQINSVRKKLADQKPSLAKKIPVGHADTREMWTKDGYGKDLLKANPDQGDYQPVDFIGVQEFTYWEGYDITNLTAFKTESLPSVKAVAGNIPIWITETGWPSSGPKCCDKSTNELGKPGLLARPGKDEAEAYWKGVGCDTLFAGTGTDATNTWWFRIFASTAKSKEFDGDLNWRILSDVESDPPKSAFPLDCKVPAPKVAAAGDSKSAAAGPGVPSSVLGVSGLVSLVALLGLCGLVN